MTDHNVYDKKGIPILCGDIVKVFHFVGARKKRYYMYKQCIGISSYNENGELYMFFSHLNFNEHISSRDGPYPVKLGTILTDYEIVQSINYETNYEHRERKNV